MTERDQPISRQDLAIINLIRGEVGGEPYGDQTTETDRAISFAILGRIDAEFVSKVKRIRDLDRETYKLKRKVMCDNHCDTVWQIPCVACNITYRRPLRFTMEGQLWRDEREKVAGEKTSRAQQALRRMENKNDDE
tara:strand:+ start:562 stop:969 length:408 start_codon:yes stop_codon:yes gene_type:complete